MTIKQVSVFIKNAPGVLAEVIKQLTSFKIKIYALTISEAEDFGILRMIVSQPEIAIQALEKKHYVARLTGVVGVALKREKGELAELLKQWTEEDIFVEYMYSFAIHNKEHNEIMVFKLSNQEKAIEVVKLRTKIKLLTDDFIMNLENI